MTALPALRGGGAVSARRAVAAGEGRELRRRWWRGLLRAPTRMCRSMRERVLFAGKKSAGDPWAIWELTLSDHSLRKVIGGATDAVRPMYLPGDRLVYARRGQKGFQTGGGGARWIGHSCRSVTRPEARCPTTCLRMGGFFLNRDFRWARERPRRCSWCIRMDPEWSRTAATMAQRAGAGGSWRRATWCSRMEPSLARFTSPLAHEVRVAAPQAEYAGGIAELESGEWLVSARPNAKASYAIEIWKPGTAELRTVYARAGEDLVEPDSR